MQKEHRGILKATEGLALFVVMHYCLFRFMEPTSFDFMYSSLYSKLTFFSLLVVGFLRLAIGLWEEYKTSGITKGLIAKILLIGISGICCILLEIKYEYTFFLYLLVAAFCLYGIDADKILKAFSICIGTMLVTTILCCLAGAIPNNLYFSSEGSRDHLLRASYGVTYPTNFASYFVFLFLFLWCSGNRKPVLPLLGLILLTGLFIYNHTNSNSSELCLLLIAVFILWESLEHRFLYKYNKILDITGWIASLAFPILGVIFYGLTWLYGKGNAFAIQADTFLHGRLSLTWDGIQTYGINAFGAATTQNGAGGGDIPLWTGSYNFLDSSYGLMLVRYGWVLTLVVTVLWVWMTRRAVRTGHRALAYAMLIIAVHSFSEHHFPEINYNILLAMPLCYLLPCEEQESKKLPEKSIVRWVPWLVFGSIAVCCLIFLPLILARLRTVVDLNGWENSLPVFICCLLCVILIGLLMFFLSRLICSRIEKKTEKMSCVGLICTVCIICGVFGWMGITVYNGAGEIRLSTDADPIHIILSTTDEPVYADPLEELYQREYSGITGHIWTPEELAGIRKGTILMDREPEKNKLIETGAIYAEISDYSSIYTYDKDVAEALRSAGYTCRGYYYSERVMDNRQIAELNNLETSEDGSLVLTRDEKKICDEPKLSLYSGAYRTTFELSLDSQPDEETVCIVAVTTHAGENQVFQREIMANEFDKNGHAFVVCDYTIHSSPLVRFEVEGRSSLKVNRISWKRNESVDTWRTFDDKGRLLGEAYYSLDGKSVERSGGFSAITQEFDKTGRLIARQYLNAEKQPVTRTDGYSEVKWILNETTKAYDLIFYDDQGNIIDNRGLNLAQDVPDSTEGWSDWMSPIYDTANSCINIGTLNLGDKQVGDVFTCQIEIEFMNVQATDNQTLRFWTQGSADGEWGIGNIWTNSLVNLDIPPHDGIYTFTVTNTVNEKMVNISNFDMAFRCDYWKSGYFRVRKVKVEKGDTVSEWTPSV